MILNFGDKATADIYNGELSKEARKLPRELWKLICRKLDMINAAYDLRDLTLPPANRLEKLKGKFIEFYSIRVNDQFRIIFRWHESNAKDVKVTDYH